MSAHYFTDDHEQLREEIQQFIENEITEDVLDQEQIQAKTWRKFGATSFLKLGLSEEFGGRKADFFHVTIFLEELARIGLGRFNESIATHYLTLTYISKYGSRFLKRNYITPGMKGEKIGALAINDPSGGSDASNLHITAIHEQHNYRINGQKSFVTNGTNSDFLVLACRTDPHAGPGGISLFVVDRETPGFSRRELKMLGNQNADIAEVAFGNAKIPMTQMIGQENMGFYYINECYLLERLLAAMMALANAEYCLEQTLKHVSHVESRRSSFSLSVSLRQQFSSLASELEAARQLTYYAGWLYEEGLQSIKHSSMAKLRATEVYKKISDACLQIYGLDGAADSQSVAQMFRDARMSTLLHGSSEVMREIIARLIIDSKGYNAPVRSLPEQTTTRKAEAQREKSSPGDAQTDNGVLQKDKDEAIPGEKAKVSNRKKAKRKPAEKDKEINEIEKKLEEEFGDTEAVTKQFEAFEKDFPALSDSEKTPDFDGEESELFAAMEKAFAIEQLETEISEDEISEPVKPAAKPKKSAEKSPRKKQAKAQSTRSKKAKTAKSSPIVVSPKKAGARKKRAGSKNGAKNGASQTDAKTDVVSIERDVKKTIVEKNAQSVAAIVNTFPERFQSRKAKGFQAVLHYKITGSGGGNYTVKIEKGHCLVEEGLTGKSTCVIETTDKNFIDMETGKTNPQIAFMLGKIKTTDIKQLMKFVKLFKKMS